MQKVIISNAHFSRQNIEEFEKKAVRKVGGKLIFPGGIRGRFPLGNNFPQPFLLALLKF